MSLVTVGSQYLLTTHKDKVFSVSVEDVRRTINRGDFAAEGAIRRSTRSKASAFATVTCGEYVSGHRYHPTQRHPTPSSTTMPCANAFATSSTPPGKIVNLKFTNSLAPNSSLFGPTATLKLTSPLTHTTYRTDQLPTNISLNHFTQPSRNIFNKKGVGITVRFSFFIPVAGSESVNRNIIHYKNDTSGTSSSSPSLPSVILRCMRAEKGTTRTSCSSSLLLLDCSFIVLARLKMPIFALPRFERAFLRERNPSLSYSDKHGN
jgi:hypothetical protein